jgi:hypothetical protein
LAFVHQCASSSVTIRNVMPDCDQDRRQRAESDGVLLRGVRLVARPFQCVHRHPKADEQQGAQQQ